MAELNDVIRRIEADAATEHGRAKTRIGIIGFLLVFVMAYMSWMYISLGKLDAAFLASAARGQIQVELPGLRAQLSQQMIDQAPGLIAHGIEQLKRAPPLLSQQAENMIAEKTKGALLDLEDQLDAELGYDLEDRLTQLGVVKPDGSPEEQIELVLDEVRDDYRTKMEGLVDEMYVQYADELGAVNEFLTRLQSADDLSPRERIQKDIIECTVSLRDHFIEVHEPNPRPGESGPRESD